jgi:hypothetical protein
VRWRTSTYGVVSETNISASSIHHTIQALKQVTLSHLWLIVPSNFIQHRHPWSSPGNVIYCPHQQHLAMDSMGSLQGSLPLSNRRQNTILSPFKQTACALTNLFKTASAEIDCAYSDGAREALELLLSSMDRENLGLQEGEGWRVRQIVMGIYETLGGGVPMEQPEEQKPQEEEEVVPPATSQPQNSDDRMSTDHPSSPLPPPPVEEPTPEPQPSPQPTPVTRFSIPSTDFTFQSSFHARKAFGDFVDAGPPTTPDNAHAPSDRWKSPPSLSNAVTLTAKPSAKIIISTPLGPGAGFKRRTSPNRDSSDTAHRNLARDGNKRVRHSEPDQ